MSKIDNIDNFVNSDKSDYSDKSDLSKYLLDEAPNIIRFIESDFPRIAKKHDITQENIGQFVTTDIYGKFMLSTRFEPVTDFTSQIITRFKVLGIKFPKPTHKNNRDDEQLIYVMEEISELSFGGGHELKTLVRIIYLIQQVIANK